MGLHMGTHACCLLQESRVSDVCFPMLLLCCINRESPKLDSVRQLKLRISGGRLQPNETIWCIFLVKRQGKVKKNFGTICSAHFICSLKMQLNMALWTRL